MDREREPAQERIDAMRTANPSFIPRNHRVEAALSAAIDRQDFQPFEELLEVVSRPFEDRPDRDHYTTPARPEDAVAQTFCGGLVATANAGGEDQHAPRVMTGRWSSSTGSERHVGQDAPRR